MVNLVPVHLPTQWPNGTPSHAQRRTMRAQHSWRKPEARCTCKQSSPDLLATRPATGKWKRRDKQRGATVHWSPTSMPPHRSESGLTGPHANARSVSTPVGTPALQSKGEWGRASGGWIDDVVQALVAATLITTMSTMARSKLVVPVRCESGVPNPPSSACSRSASIPKSPTPSPRPARDAQARRRENTLPRPRRTTSAYLST